MSRLQSTPLRTVRRNNKLRITAAHTLVTNRAGVSMIEVLVSMFILSIGLLSIASLLPVGQSQVVQADIEDRSSVVGQNAFRTFSIRGYANPLFWVNDPNSTRIATINKPAATIVTQRVFIDSSTGIIPKPIFIDPVLASSTGATTKNVPHTGTRLFDRFSIKTNATYQPTFTTVNTIGAEACFVSQDDLVNEPRTAPDQAPIASVEMISGVPARRQFEGNFSWMAMLMPKSVVGAGLIGEPYPGQECELSIIVFYKRSPSIFVNSSGTSTERTLSISSFDGGGINGGEVTFNASPSSNLLISPGGWMLLYGERVITPTPPSGSVTHHTAAKWYKILSAERVDPASPPATRQITLTGPDWDATTFPAGSTSAVIFDDAVAVYTKSIRLEGQSSWSAWDGL